MATLFLSDNSLPARNPTWLPIRSAGYPAAAGHPWAVMFTHSLSPGQDGVTRIDPHRDKQQAVAGIFLHSQADIDEAKDVLPNVTLFRSRDQQVNFVHSRR